MSLYWVLKFFISFIACASFYEKITANGDKLIAIPEQQCQSIHARSWGITLACCSTNAPLPEHCKYNTPHMCKFPHCSCTIIVDVDNLRCSDEAPQREWKDHETSPDGEPFQCRNPNFPNERGEFVLTLQIQSRSLTKPFLLGLSKYKIIDLTLIVNLNDGEADGKIPVDLFDYFPLIKSVRIFPSSNQTSSTSKQDILPQSLGNLDQLQMLSLINLSSLYKLPEKIDFAPKLQYLLIQNCPNLKFLPDWFFDLKSITYAKLTKTSVKNVSSLSTLEGIQFLYLPFNKINDLSSIIFESDNLKELDLSNNEICCIGATTFSKATSLKYLDLSDNPIKRLPSGGFIKLQNLQWLYLKRTVISYGLKHKTALPSLQSLTPDMLAGLKKLEYLSLENNPDIMIHRQAFASLASLRSLDLSHCNLTLLPESVMHLCQLRFLWLKFNRFRYSSSISMSTLAMLPLSDLDVFDLSENSLTQNPYALFLVPLENTALIESIVHALKHQPLWWHDECARRHWRLRLVHHNQNRTLRTFYSNLLADQAAIQGDSMSSLDDAQCEESYKKIVKELDAYETLKDSTTCARFLEQRRMNRRFRQQLSQIESLKNKGANFSKNPCPPIFVGEGENTKDSSVPLARQHGDNEESSRGQDSVDRAFKLAQDEHNEDIEDTRISQDMNVFDNLPPFDDCSHLYTTIDIFGYVLAANFLILIIVTLSCIVMLCKQRRRRAFVQDHDTQ